MIKWQISLPVDDFFMGQILILFILNVPWTYLPYLCTRNQTSKVWLRAFFVYRNPVPFLKLKFGEYLAVQPFNIIFSVNSLAMLTRWCKKVE